MAQSPHDQTAALTLLADRVEAAPHTSQAEWLRIAATLMLGSVPDAMNAMLAASAYESAALMLVPEGWHPNVNSHPLGDLGNCEWTWVADFWESALSCAAATPALALCAASLRARATQTQGNG